VTVEWTIWSQQLDMVSFGQFTKSQVVSADGGGLFFVGESGMSILLLVMREVDICM
jgi:hypothetical protein